MNQARFRFYGSLNDFLESDHRQTEFAYAFNSDQSIKHLLEALGVPHTEVDLILINGEAVNFSTLVQARDRISIYPRFTSIDISDLEHVRPLDLGECQFILDNHLGKLAGYLRMLGFDTYYQNDYQDAELAQISNDEKRILLTRDRDLLKRRLVTYGYWVREKEPRRQLVEILRRFDLFSATQPFTRCLRCNGLLKPVPKGAIEHRLLPKTRRYYNTFAICQDCQQIYWQGSHWEKMQKFIDSIQTS
jgi:uncharacterized protein with PIN domain